MMNRVLLVLCLLIALVVAGCGWAPVAAKELVSEGLLIRSIVVKNDWVYVKENNTLYRRYIPGRGVGPFRINHGNVILLAAVKTEKEVGWIATHTPFDGKITRSSAQVKVYGNFQKALESNPSALISSESRLFVPVKKKSPM